ncbi:MAG: DUF2147 domain-containing protein [Saprospiraceae bacterium]
MKKSILYTFLFLTSSLYAIAQSPVGTWKTIDDNSGEARSHVEIYEQNGRFFGKISKLLKSEPGVVCDECKGDKKDKPVLGLVIIENLQANKDYWKGGTILDPESGNDYNCSIWFEDGNTEVLKVRGKHWTGLYRTQTWYRVKG